MKCTSYRVATATPACATTFAIRRVPTTSVDVDGDPKDAELMLRVSWSASTGPLRHVQGTLVEAHIPVPLPVPPLTDAEMNTVMYAAKMAAIDVLRARSKTARKKARCV